MSTGKMTIAHRPSQTGDYTYLHCAVALSCSDTLGCIDMVLNGGVTDDD